jgi:hypothetical protein
VRENGNCCQYNEGPFLFLSLSLSFYINIDIYIFFFSRSITYGKKTDIEYNSGWFHYTVDIESENVQREKLNRDHYSLFVPLFIINNRLKILPYYIHTNTYKHHIYSLLFFLNCCLRNDDTISNREPADQTSYYTLISIIRTKLMWICETMNEQKRDLMVENSTKIISYILSSLSSDLSSSSSSSPPPVRTRTVVNAIYITGIAFMIGIFLLLLWVNLFSRHCWCWHDTSVGNRFNPRWLIRHSIIATHDSSSSKNRQQQRPSNEDELEWIFSLELSDLHTFTWQNKDVKRNILHHHYLSLSF